MTRSDNKSLGKNVGRQTVVHTVFALGRTVVHHNGEAPLLSRIVQIFNV
jgi:hypothetical protein